jgi:hypothetical protein
MRKLLITAAIIMAIVFGYPLIREDVSNPCAAVDAMVVRQNWQVQNKPNPNECDAGWFNRQMEHETDPIRRAQLDHTYSDCVNAAKTQPQPHTDFEMAVEHAVTTMMNGEPARVRAIKNQPSLPPALTCVATYWHRTLP